MIQRRHFLGTVAAFLTTPAVSKLSAANAVAPGTLNWQNEVIETVPHNRARRSPVVTGVVCNRPMAIYLRSWVTITSSVCTTSNSSATPSTWTTTKTGFGLPDFLLTDLSWRQLATIDSSFFGPTADGIAQRLNDVTPPRSLNVHFQIMERIWRPSDSNRHCEFTMPKRVSRSSG